MRKHKPRDICKKVYAREPDGAKFTCGSVVRDGTCPTCERRGNRRKIQHPAGGTS